MKKALDKAVDRVTYVFCFVAGILFVVIILLLLANIILRSAFNGGITGQYELVQYGIMICVGLGMARTSYANRHIHVDLVVNYMNWRLKSFVEFFGRLICTAVYGYATYLLINTANNAAKYYKVTDLYRIPFQYIYWIFFAVLTLTTLVFLYQTCVYFVGIFVNYNKREKEAAADKDEAAGAL